MPQRIALDTARAGRYASAFWDIASTWTMKDETGATGHRTGLDPERYSRCVRDWTGAGAAIVGGGGAVNPAQIKRMRELLGRAPPHEYQSPHAQVRLVSGQNSRGSVMLPVIAEAAAVAGDAR